MTSTLLARRAADRRVLGRLAKGLTTCALIASASLFQIWVRTQATEQGYRLSRLSAEERELSREHERLQLQAARLLSAERIADLAQARLGMGPPSGDRIVVLVGSASRSPGAALAAQ